MEELSINMERDKETAGQAWIRIIIRIALAVVVLWLLMPHITIAQAAPILGVCAVYGLLTKAMDEIIERMEGEDGTRNE
jgi:hypothetical protein